MVGIESQEVCLVRNLGNDVGDIADLVDGLCKIRDCGAGAFACRNSGRPRNASSACELLGDFLN
jgi:hypothetical protein